MDFIIPALVLAYSGIQYVIYTKQNPAQSFYRRISKISKNSFFVSMVVYVAFYVFFNFFNPLGLTVVMMLFGMSVLSFSFDLISQRIKQTQIQTQALSLIYAFGIFCNFMLTFSILIESDTSSELIAGGFGVAFVLGLLNTICSLMVFLFVSFLGLFNSPVKRPRRQRSARRSLDVHYEELGMTSSEVESFRQEMSHVKSLILQLEDSLEETGKMRALALRYNIVAVLKRFFKDIVTEANRVNDAERFIYHFLPSLVDLVNKYNEIQGHIAKNKQTYLILERSASAIEQLMIDIIDEYTAFHEKNIQDLEFEVELAAKSRSRKETDFSIYSSEKILNDFFDEDLFEEEEA